MCSFWLFVKVVKCRDIVCRLQMVQKDVGRKCRDEDEVKRNIKWRSRLTRDGRNNARPPCPEVFGGRLKTIATFLQKTMLRVFRGGLCCWSSRNGDRLWV